MPAKSWHQIERDLEDLYGCDLWETEVGKEIEELYSA